MSRAPLGLRLLAAALALAATPALSRAEDAGAPIAFRRIADAGLANFATQFFERRYPRPSNWSFGARFIRRVNWTALVSSETYAASVDLVGTGERDLILLVNDPDWCDDHDCLAPIFRPTVKGYEFICEGALPLSGARLLAQKENGYRLIGSDTAIVHWEEQQDYDAGSLCSVEIKAR
jgi:hypothetical protein